MNELKYGAIKNLKYYSKLCKPEHFFIKYGGFGCSISELQLMEHNDVKFIIISYISNKGGIKTYLSTLEQWIKSEKTYIFQYNGIDDKQNFLSIKDMWEID